MIYSEQIDNSLGGSVQNLWLFVLDPSFAKKWSEQMYRSWQIYLTGRKKCACIYQEHNFARILSLAR